MLYVQEKVVKLGGIYLEGQVTSVEVQEAGSVYVAQDEKGSCLLYTSPSPRDRQKSRMPSSA